MKIELAGAAILVLIVFGASAFAQQDAPQKVEYRKWDLGTTVGMLVSSKRDFGRPRSYSTSHPSGALALDAGRFLTTHLKLDMGLWWTEPRSFYESINSGTPTYQTTGYTVRDVRPTTVSGGLTYQFFENAFIHPYVTGGARLTVLREQRETYSYPTTSAASTTVTASQTSLQARPFGAFGFKSYFNERWFVRSELLLAFDRLGVSHGTARIGFGVDF